MDVEALLLNIGVSPHLSGFQALVDAIGLALDDPSYLRSLSKRLYPDVAKMRGEKSAVSAERAIRHAIERAFDMDWATNETIKAVFGNSVSQITGKPTNGAFIAAVTIYLRRQRRICKTQ